MRTELIIISYNTVEITLDCIRSAVENGGDSSLSICVVDNNSSDDTVSQIEMVYPETRIIRNEENFGYAKACNIGVYSSAAEYIILSNSDIIFQEDSIVRLCKALEDEKVGVVGPQQYFPNGRMQRSAGFAPGVVQSIFDFGLDKIYRNLCWNTNQSPQYPNGYIDGGVLAFRKSIYTSFQGMDEAYFFYTEEADLCFRVAKEGYRNSTLYHSKVVHLRGSSSQSIPNEKSLKMLVESKKIFLNKHRPSIVRILTRMIEKGNYGLRWWLAKKGITIVDDSKIRTYEILYKAWKRVRN